MPEFFPQFLKLGFFWLAIALLVAVTLGVAYLTIVEFKDRKDRSLQVKSDLKNQAKNSSSPNFNQNTNQKTNPNISQKRNSKKGS
jgi:uncharacterized protein (UPF0333 family)